MEKKEIEINKYWYPYLRSVQKEIVSNKNKIDRVILFFKKLR